MNRDPDSPVKKERICPPFGCISILFFDLAACCPSLPLRARPSHTVSWCSSWAGAVSFASLVIQPSCCCLLFFTKAGNTAPTLREGCKAQEHAFFCNKPSFLSIWNTKRCRFPFLPRGIGKNFLVCDANHNIKEQVMIGCYPCFPIVFIPIE